MDTTEIFFKSAAGIMHEADDLHYDAVRLLRLVGWHGDRRRAALQFLGPFG
jgi:hypothetical protein